MNLMLSLLRLVCFAMLFAEPPASGQVPVTLVYPIPAPPVGAQPGAALGQSVAVDGSFTVVGAPGDALETVDSGLVKVFDTATGALLHIFRNPVPQASAGFGTSVAISGTRVVVGAPGASNGGGQSGRAYLYDLAGSTPTEPVATLSNPTPAVGSFGLSVGISGTRVLVGGSGGAFVYNLTGVTPALPVATLSDPSAGNGSFGYAVAIDGLRLAVGSPSDNTFGSAFVYDLGSGTPSVPIATLNNPNPANTDSFGYAVAISGQQVVVGAPYDDTGNTDAGSAYVYDLTSGTPTVPAFELNNPTPADVGNFGYSVGISGQRLVIGSGFAEVAGGDALGDRLRV